MTDASLSEWGRASLFLVCALALSLLVAGSEAAADSKPQLSKLEVISLLQERRFDELEAFFRRRGDSEEPICCIWGMAAFEHSDPANQAALDDWVAARPASHVALMARGTYNHHLARLLRGDETMVGTSRQQLRQMRPYYQRALEDFRRAIDLNPRVLSNYESLIQIGMVQGRHRFVDQVYRRARDVFPDSPKLAETYLFSLQPKWRGDRQTFFGFLEHLKERHGDDERFAFLDRYSSGNERDPAANLEWQEKYEELLAHSEARLAKRERAGDLRWRAIALERLGRREEALADLRRAMELAPYWDAPHKILVRTYLWMNKMDEARAALDEYVARDPYDPDRLQHRAGVLTYAFARHFSLVQPDEAAYDALFEQALKDLDRAAHFGRGRSDVAARRAQVLERRGEDQGAVIAERRRAAKLTPYDPERWRELALAFYQQGDCKALIAFQQYAVLCRRSSRCHLDHYFENVIHEGGKTDQCFGLAPEEPQQSTIAEPQARFELDYPVCGPALRIEPPEKVVEFCREKAEAGDPKAQYELYKFYTLGLLVERDWAEGGVWLERAAEANYGPALTRSAYNHLYGRYGHEVDFEKALDYFERGMAIGFPEAFIGLSRAFYHGQEVAPNRRMARELLDRAIELGSQEARRQQLRYFPDEG